MSQQHCFLSNLFLEGAALYWGLLIAPLEGFFLSYGQKLPFMHFFGFSKGTQVTFCQGDRVSGRCWGGGGGGGGGDDGDTFIILMNIGRYFTPFLNSHKIMDTQIGNFKSTIICA